MAGHDTDRARPARRPAAGRGSRALGMGALRRQCRYLARRHHADAAGAAHDPRGDPRRERDRAPARTPLRPPEPGGGPALRITTGPNTRTSHARPVTPGLPADRAVTSHRFDPAGSARDV